MGKSRRLCNTDYLSVDVTRRPYRRRKPHIKNWQRIADPRPLVDIVPIDLFNFDGVTDADGDKNC